MSDPILKNRKSWPVSPTKSVTILSLTMILALIVSTALLLLNLRNKELAQAKGETVNLSRILAEQTTHAFDGIVLMMMGVRERLEDDYGVHLQLDSLPVRLLLATRSSGLPQVKSVFLVDDRGLGVNSSRSDFVKLLPMQHREFFSHFAAGGKDAVFIGRPEIARVDGQWTYYVSIALKDALGRFRGVLVSAVNIEYFDALYRSIDLDAVSRIALLNRQGMILAGQRQSNDMLGEFFLAQDRLAGLQRLRESDTVETLTDDNGQKRLTVFHSVAKYPLVVSASVSEGQALEAWREITRAVVLGVAAVVLFVIVTTALLARNLARRESLEAALLDSGEQLRQMIESAKDAIVTLDADNRVMMFNQAAERLFAIAAERAPGRSFIDLLASRLSPEQVGRIERCMVLCHCQQGEECRKTIDLSRPEAALFVDLNLSSTLFRGEKLVTAVFRDVTERYHAELALRESNRQLHELTMAQDAVRESERTRIARELHDELGQLLTGVRLEVSWLGGRLLPEQRMLTERVDTVKSQIDLILAAVRRISSELRPLVLDDLGLVAAASWYLDQCAERSGLDIRPRLPDQGVEVEGTVATALFRILQESMTNIVRHAGATTVEVRLSCEEDCWRLCIEDDGQGFDVGGNKRRGFGIVGMRERVQILGGGFDIRSAPGEGTRIEVLIPVVKGQKNGNGKTESIAG